MRILIKMLPLNEPASVPLDNYPFAGLIYRSVWLAAPDYAEFLHADGYPAMTRRESEVRPTEFAPDGHKRFKFFVFSRLEQPGKRIANGRQWLGPRPVLWQVSSPIDELIELLAEGLCAQEAVSIGDQDGVTHFTVTDVLEIPAPEITSQMRFRTLSPLFVAVDETGEDGRHRKHHLRAEESQFAQQVVANLLGKYRALTGQEPLEPGLEFGFEGIPKPQLVQYKGTHHHSYLGTFVVSGSEELVRVGWECGFGEANSKGFGMVAACD